MNKEKISNRIKNLLELSANNPSEEEARAAFLKAQELMLKYHIDNPETLEEDRVYTAGIDLGKHDKTEFILLLSVLCADGFRSKTFTSDQRIIFMGFEEDAKAALAAYTYLLVHSAIACKEYFIKNTFSHQAKREWEYGYIYGLHQAMNARKGYEIMRTVPGRVTEAYNNLPVEKYYDSDKDSGLGIKSLNGAFADGYRRGKDSLSADHGRKKEDKCY